MKPYRAFTGKSRSGVMYRVISNPGLENSRNWKPPVKGTGIECPLCGKEYRTLLGTHCQRTHNMTVEEYLSKTGLFKYQCSSESFKKMREDQGKKMIVTGKINKKKTIKGRGESIGKMAKRKKKIQRLAFI